MREHSLEEPSVLLAGLASEARGSIEADLDAAS